ncbi:MAG: LLM class F420-dependent oxidoreductase [Acidobacteria bacterium]|nr:LLM class F420-dependent oxidoreductase [Acidobacteriota bacterium]
MKVGCTLPQSGSIASPENMIRVATHAETLGYDSVWVFERLLWATNPRDPYPPSPDGSWPANFQNVFDPIETLTFVAAHTRNVRLGTSVIVLPYYQPIQLARRLATLDVLSGGRLEICGGVGWSRDEFEAMGVPFARRGERADEILEAMIAIWTRDPVSFDGQFYKIPESKIGPKPIQQPHPPIHLAGFGQYTFDRAAKFGNGWNPAGVMDFDSFDASVKQLQATAHASGRGDLEVVLLMYPVVTETPLGHARRPMVGSLAELRHDVNRLREIGVTHLIFSPPEMGSAATSSIEPALSRLENFLELTR